MREPTKITMVPMVVPDGQGGFGFVHVPVDNFLTTETIQDKECFRLKVTMRMPVYRPSP